MEEEDDERKNRRPNLAAFSSLNARVVHSLEEGYIRQQASSESADANTCSSISTAQYSDRSFVSKTSTFSRSGTSSSSQEECEVAHTTISSGQYLAAARVETARSMESLRPCKETSPARPASSCTTVRTHRSSFLTASERDVRETRGLPARRALSGEDMGNSAEKKRGLFASTERRALQQLSLPPPERRLTILSPHSPMPITELQWPSPSGIRGRRKKGMVLPKLILPRSDSDASEVFIERWLFFSYSYQFSVERKIINSRLPPNIKLEYLFLWTSEYYIFLNTIVLYFFVCLLAKLHSLRNRLK